MTDPPTGAAPEFPWRLSRLAPGLPAAAGLALLCVLGGVREAPQRQTERYVAAATAAARAGAWDDARLLWQRVCQLAPSRAQARLALADALLRLGQPRAAFQLAASQAPIDDDAGAGRTQPGRSADAHLWIVDQLLASRPLTPDTLRLALRHLRAVLEQAPTHLRAAERLARLLAALDEDEEALEWLSRIVSAAPYLHLELAQVLGALARKVSGQDGTDRDLAGRARMHAGRAESVHRAWLATALERARAAASRHPGPVEPGAATPDDEIDAVRCRLAEARLLQADFDGARDAVEPIRDPALRRQRLARVLTLWGASLSRAQPAVAARTWLEALELSPTDRSLLPRLVELAGRHPGPVTEAVAAGLRRLLDAGEPARLAGALGTIALLQRDHRAARAQFEAALVHGRAPSLLNNLAWSLAHEAEPELERALGLIDEAIGLRPTDARLRNTRGVILVKLGRWRAALADLQATHHVARDRASLLRLMSECYDQLGMADEARAHRRQAARLDARPPR